MEIEEITKDTRPQEYNANNPLNLVNPFNLLIVGKRGSGKTNLLINLILKYLDFDTLTLCVAHKTFSYKLLDDLLKKDLQDYEDNGAIKWYDNPLKIPGIEEFDKTKQNLVIFDDMMSTNAKEKKIMTKWFVESRHASASVVNLVQDIKNGIPPTGRRNLTHVILFHGLDNEQLTEAFKHWVGGDIKKETFIDLYRRATPNKFDFLFIDIENPSIHMRYRKGFDQLYDPIAHQALLKNR